MKKIFTFFLVSILLFAGVKDIERAIYAHILFALFPHTPTVKIWVDEPKKEEIVQRINGVTFVKDIHDADLLLIFHEKSLNNISVMKSKALIFVGSYSLLKKVQERAIGGFFWQKGRPNIIFLEKNLKKYNIVLPDEFSRYIESKL